MARLRAAFFLNEGQEQSAAPIVMVAGGSGMAPIASMLRSLAEENTDREIVFYYGTRARSVICSGAKIMKALASQLKSFQIIPTLAPPQAVTEWGGEVGLVTEVLDRLSGNLRGSEAYLCGPPSDD